MKFISPDDARNILARRLAPSLLSGDADRVMVLWGDHSGDPSGNLQPKGLGMQDINDTQPAIY